MHRRNLIFGATAAGVIIVVVALWRMNEQSDFAMLSVGSRGEEVGGSYATIPSAGIAYDSNDMVKIAPELDSRISPPYPSRDGAGISTVDNRMIIKTGNFSVVSENVSESATKIIQLAESKQGIVVSNQVYNMDTNPQATVVVRVPVASFTEVVSQIKTVGVVQSESINGTDVTEEYVDLEAQLGNLKATETQFLEIMKKATQIQDILSVQRELTNVRSQIESLEGRMKYLGESTDYSTITVYLSSDKSSLPVVSESDDWKFVGEVKEALRSLIQFGKEMVSVIVRIVIFAPVWIVIGLIVWLIIRKIKKTTV